MLVSSPRGHEVTIGVRPVAWFQRLGGGHFRAEGAAAGGGSRPFFSRKRPFSLRRALPHIIFVFVSVFIFQIETFGMKELSTINAKKVLNNKHVTAYL